MEPAREESVFTCPIRQGVKQSESNTMNVFIRGQQKIRRRQCPETRTSFILSSAENYELPSEVDRCYFFNPFSVEILHSVLARIYESYYENPREILLFFYYPSEEYISCLMTEEQLMFYDEIDTSDLFPGEDKRERIMIFEVIL